MTQVSTFAVSTNGWTQNNYDAGNKKMSLSKGNCFVHFWWDDTSASIHGTSIGMYQSLGFISAGTNPWAHTNDSGNGANASANLDTERGIKYIGPGPYTSLHMFGHTDTDVIYVALEIAPGLYRHFGFGNITKIGTWVGGEWVGGHHWNPQNSGAAADFPSHFVHSVLLDGHHYGNTGGGFGNSVRVAATMHIEGLPNQPTANQYYGVVGRPEDFDAWDEDRDANARGLIEGGIRDGLGTQQFGWLQPDLSKGFIPIIPAEIFYWDLNPTTSEDRYPLGRMHNCGTIQMRGIDPQQALTVGADTWRAFPCVRKSFLQANNYESWNMGIIYKQ